MLQKWDPSNGRGAPLFIDKKQRYRKLQKCPQAIYNFAPMYTDAPGARRSFPPGIFREYPAGPACHAFRRHESLAVTSWSSPRAARRRLGPPVVTALPSPRVARRHERAVASGYRSSRSGRHLGLPAVTSLPSPRATGRHGSAVSLTTPISSSLGNPSSLVARGPLPQQ